MKKFTKNMATLVIGSSLMFSTLTACGALDGLIPGLTGDKKDGSTETGSSSSSSSSSKDSSSSSSSGSSSSSSSGSSASASAAKFVPSGETFFSESVFGSISVVISYSGSRGYLTVGSNDNGESRRVINGNNGNRMSFVTETLGGKPFVPVYDISADSTNISFTHRVESGTCQDYSGAYNAVESYYSVFEAGSQYPCSK